MKDSEFQSIISGLISAAKQFVDGELSPERAKATDYYHGRPFGNEEPGRSQFVSTEVRDGISSVIPGMARVLFSSDKAVEFRPPSQEDVAGAEQATDAIQYIFAEENPGFLNTVACIKDGLLKKSGYFKWWWEEGETSNHRNENVTEEQILVLAADEDVEITLIEPAGETEVAGPDGQPAKVPVYNVEMTRTIKEGRARYDVVPPEEVLFQRELRVFDKPHGGVWHRTRKTTGELLAMGVKQKDIDEHGGDESDVKDNEEALARSFNQTSAEETEAGEANDKHLYVEGYVYIDFDGDGEAELRKVCALGPGHYPVQNKPLDEVPMSMFCPDPEPHSVVGLSYADKLMDLQRYKSMLMRAMSDSLALSIFPRLVYKAGDANLPDILNTQMAAPIRSASGPGSVAALQHQFLGKEALPVIQLVDDINERRTGNNRGAAGLDADALQSSTRTAVAAAVSASQAQQEMLVRIFAESALKPLFKGLLKLLVTHQPRKRMVRLRNKWVEVDPRSWNANMDVQVNVALGAGLLEEKVQTLLEISAKQAELLEKMPDNPIVGLVEYRNTLAEIAELRGKKDSTRYFKPFTAEDEKAMKEAAAQQPPPETPEMVLAKAQIEIERMKAEAQDKRETLKVQRDLMLKQAQLAMDWKTNQMEDERDRIKAQLEDDRERDKQAADQVLAIQEMELKHQAQIEEAELKAEIEIARATTQAGPGEDKSVETSTVIPEAPRKKRRRFSVERDENNRMIGGEVIEEDVDG